MGRRTKQEIADDIRQQESQLAHVSGFTTAGVDTAYVPDREAFNGYRHQQIWNLVHQNLDPDALGQAASAWSDRAQNLHDLFETFHQTVQHELSSWSGTFANSAEQHANAYVTAAVESHDSALTVQRLMELNSSAAQTVKGAIPPPPAAYVPNPDPAKEAADCGRALRAYQDKAAAAEADAQDACNHIYNPTLPASGDSVPKFVAAPPGPQDQHPAGPEVMNPDGGEKNSISTPGTNDTAKDSKPGDGKPGSQPTDDGSQSNTGADQTQPASTTSSSATTPASTLGSASVAPPSGVSSQTMPSTVTTPGVAAGTGPDPGGSTAGVPGRSDSSPVPGKSVSGQPLSPTAQASSVARAAQSAVPATSSPTSGMPHAGHGKESKDSDERTHSSPEYLRRRYEELSELPPAMSGVIGPSQGMHEDRPAAEPVVPAQPAPVDRQSGAGTGPRPLVTGTGPLGAGEEPPTFVAPPAPHAPPGDKGGAGTGQLVTGKGTLGDNAHPSDTSSLPPAAPKTVTGKGPLGDDE